MAKSQAQKAKEALEASKAAQAAKDAQKAGEKTQPTEAEKKAAQDAKDKEAKDKKDAEDAKKATEAAKPKKGVFVNPLTTSISYDDFIASIAKGKTVAQHCAGKLEKHEIDWLTREVAAHKANKKKK